MNNFMCKTVYLIVLLLTVISPFGRSIKFNNLSDLKEHDKTFNEVSFKYILEWFSTEGFWGTGQESFLLYNCPVNTCYITSNRSYLKSIADFDALFFYNKHIPKGLAYNPEPLYRSSHQKYIFLSGESAHYYPVCDERYDNNYFNWTFTYKLDSDEYYGYIIIRNSKGEIIGPNKTMHWMKQDSMDPVDNKFKLSLSSKSRAGAWIVSNCNVLSNRSQYVTQVRKRLVKYGLDVDIFGDCGLMKCGTDKDCFDMIRRDYYFYFVLENSIAEDYVTEKLLTALWNAAIPVVRGGANYTRFMPDGMYLNAGSMTPRELAKEMRNIIQDKERYYGFFRWRNHYSYHHAQLLPETNTLCRMCALLALERVAPTTTMHKHFLKWWNVPETSTICKNITIIRTLKRLGRTLLKEIRNPKNEPKIPWKLFGIFLIGGLFWLPQFMH